MPATAQQPHTYGWNTALRLCHHSKTAKVRLRQCVQVWAAKLNQPATWRWFVPSLAVPSCVSGAGHNSKAFVRRRFGSSIGTFPLLDGPGMRYDSVALTSRCTADFSLGIAPHIFHQSLRAPSRACAFSVPVSCSHARMVILFRMSYIV